MAVSLDYFYRLYQDFKEWISEKVSDIIFELDVAWMQIDDLYDLLANLNKKFNTFKTDIRFTIADEISKIEFPELDIDLTDVYEYIFDKVGDLRGQFSNLDSKFDRLVENYAKAINGVSNRVNDLENRITGLKRELREEVQDKFIEIIENVMEQEKK